MNFNDAQKRLEDIVAEHDYDEYETTVHIARLAEHLMNETFNSISESEAIEWAITGEEPVDLRRRIRQHMNVLHHKTSYLEKLLGFVEDDDIVEAVRSSFDMSMRLGNLTFYYGNVNKPENKVRVRILTRMGWFNKDHLFDFSI